MIIWIIFLGVCYFFLFLYENPKANKKQKSSIWVGLVLFCVYFSTFRDGLGSDYTAYQSFCERNRIYGEIWLLMEPIPAFLYNVCYNTTISAILFFFVTSVIVCVSSLWIYSRFKNFYLSAFLFLTYTNLFLSSFNLVRQFTASAIILIATYYFVMKKRSLWFFLFVLLAFLWHKSAIFSIIIYFLWQKKLNSLLWILLLLISWMFPADLLLNIPIVGDLFNTLNYMDNFSHDELAYSKTSITNLYMHFMILLCIFNGNKVKGNDKVCFNLALKLSMISVIFFNISANSLAFAYRLGIFYSVFLPILFSYLPALINKVFAKTIVYIPILFLLFVVLVNKKDDRVYCPEKILPIESIFDDNYHPYENPDVRIII